MSIPEPLMDLASLATKISGVPGLGSAFALVRGLYESVDNVKLYRQQCRELCNRCAKLLLALRDSANDMGGSRALEAADEIEDTVANVHKKMQLWASWSAVKSFVYQREIKDGIDSLYKEIDMCAVQFNISVNMDLSRGQQELMAIKERDQAEIREVLQSILKNTEDMKAVARMPAGEVEGFMESIQEQLRSPSSEPAQDEPLRQGLWDLVQKTERLPPMTDLTGQVVKLKNDPVAWGAFNDIYAGMWLDEEKVALRLPRAIMNSPAAERRFLKEVEIWRRLNHPNVSRLYGIAYFEGNVYSVSKWMENGTAISYVTSHPDVDRLKLLSEVASGMEYLHKQPIVHGDLRGANVLISTTGKACLSDFGLSKFLEQVGPGTQSVPAGATPNRWLAPELIKPSLIGRKSVSVSTNTDVWSFGMLCLELLTGQQPFADIPLEISVAMELIEGNLPERPGPAVTARGLSDELWNVMRKCWQKQPESRPSMEQVRVSIRQLRDGSGSSPGLTTVPLSSSPGRSSLHHRPSLSSNQHHTPPRSSSTLSVESIGSPTRPSPTRPGRLSSASTTSPPVHHKPSGSRLSTSAAPPSTVRQHGRNPTASSNGSIWVHEPSPTQESAKSPGSLLLHSGSEESPLEDEWGILKSLPGSRSQTGTVGRRHASSLDEFQRPSLSGRSGSLSAGPSQPIPISRPNTAREQSFPEETLDIPPVSSSLPASLPTQLSPPLASNRAESVRSVSSNSLQLAADDPASLLRRAPDGTIEAGTLEGLVERLITDSSDHRKDTEFRAVFLATYAAFTSGEKLFSKLRTRYQEADGNSQVSAADRVTMRYNVLLVMKQWLTSGSAQVDINVLSQMKDFCYTVRSSTIMTELAKDVASRIDDKLHLLQDRDLLSPTPSSAGVTNIPRPADIVPRDIAIALTILEGEKFSRIVPSDYITYFKRVAGRQNHIELASVTNNTIGNWVKKSILRSDQLETRGETYKFFVNTAEECRQLHNFASMTTIVNALNSSAIERLTLTCDVLKQQKGAERLLKSLSNLLDPSSNHRTYRAALGEARKTCVPWLAVHLRDLNSAFRMSETVDTDSRPLINFARCVKFSQRMDELSHYHAPQMGSLRNEGPLAYLESQLRSVPMHPKMEDALEARSLALEKQERRTRDLRHVQLRSVGFHV